LLQNQKSKGVGMILKGFRFGMLLQLAVGPMCLMVFNTSATYGFIYSISLIVAIALIDALYIGLSCIGTASIIDKTEIKTFIKIGGCIVLILFGLNTISGVFKISFLPNIGLFSEVTSQNLFVQGLLLTASNPLTILFWSGMFSAQMIENHWSQKQLLFFAVGCVLSTLFFLSCVALLGSFLNDFLPLLFVQILNILVGVFLIYFGIRLLLRKDKSEVKEPVM
jgi:threonine/homoserine/homoserine lactone efflux protein